MIAVQPGEGSLDDSASRENGKPLCGTRPFDDLGGPFADPAQRVPEFVTGIATIGEDIAQPRDTP